MWIIACTEAGGDQAHAHHFLVGPFGTDDQAEDTAGKLQAEDPRPDRDPAARRAGPCDGRSDVLMATTDTAAAALEARLQQIAQRLTPCPIPDFTDGWDLCAHGLPWPCPTTEAAWIARGLDRAEQVHAHITWLRGEQSAAYPTSVSAPSGRRPMTALLAGWCERFGGASGRRPCWCDDGREA
jgi:hypothetical protein